MEDIKISIIVPVYNVEQYIQVCIESILKQSWQNWELLLIDDGSTDRSGEICQNFAVNDTRIKYHKKHNGGVSSARNIGLNLATGDMISFVDSDDRVDSNYLSDFCVDKIQADLYIAGAIYDVENKPFSYKKHRRQFCRNVKEIRDCFFVQNLQSSRQPWGKVFRRDLINCYEIHFCEKLSFGEDMLFLLQYLLLCQTLFVTDTASYHYLVFDDSGRKLCSKHYSYSELRFASEAYMDEVYSMKSIWNLDEIQYSELVDNLVLSMRFNALLSLIQRKEWRGFDEEVALWKMTEYSPKDLKKRIILQLVRGWLPKPLKKLTLITLFHLKKAFAKDKTTAIYQDLDRRSTRY